MYRHLTNEELQKHMLADENNRALIHELYQRLQSGALFFAPRMERSDL